MKSILLQIANFYIELQFISHPDHQSEETKLKRETEIFCQDFICAKPKSVDRRIVIKGVSQYSIFSKADKEIFTALYIKKKNHWETYSYLSIFQLLIVIRSIVQELLSKDRGFILHGSAVKVSERASIFLGASGEGKSTISSLLASHFPKLADDILIVRRINQQYFLFQTPFIEKNCEYLKTKNGIPIESINFLIKSSQYKVKKMNVTSSLIKKVLAQLFTESANQEKQVQTLLHFLNSQIQFYKIWFGRDKNELTKLF